MEGSQLRRSMTLSEQLCIEDSPNPKLAPPTLAPAGDAEKREAFAAGSGRGSVSSRTLMDIIKEEHDSNVGAGPGINWKSFKELLSRAGAAWATPSPPISDPDVVSVRTNPAGALGRSVTIRNAEMPFPASASRRRAIVSEYNPPTAGTAEEEEDSDSPASGGSRESEEEGEGSEGSNRSGTGGTVPVPMAEEHPVRMSLMALLEQTDRWGGEGEEAPAAAAEEEVADDDDEVGDGGGTDHVCCVCMVRHKGAALIPCGHTFCRRCSRELWVSRGNCPLCNIFIQEILDIF